MHAERRGLPRIPPYPLPRDADLPPPRVAWRPARDRAALLIHDMQHYFVRAFAEGSPAIQTAIEHIDALRRHCAQAGIPVFYTVQPGRQDRRDRGLQADFWGEGMGAGADQVAIIDALSPSESDVVLTKWRYSAFQRTPLEEMLRARGRDQLLVTGIYGHIGCLLSTAEAFMRDIEPFFVADAVADFSREKHDQAIQYVAGHCGYPITTATLLAIL